MPRSKRFTEYQGERVSVAELARRHGIGRETLAYRLASGLDGLPDRVFHGQTRQRRGGRHAAKSVRPAPRLKRHKSGRAYCRWKSGGKANERYFGAYGTPEAERRYRRFAAEWLAGPIAPACESITVADLFAQWLHWCATEYRKNGTAVFPKLSQTPVDSSRFTP